jgi:hypothetical protein
MKHLKLIGVVAAALFTLGITTATTAFALPDVSLTLTGSAFPLHLEVTLLTVKTKLSSASAVVASGEGLLLLLLANELSSLGTFEALFTNVVGEGEKCFSEENGAKDPAGEVLTKGTYHIVYTSLTPLTLGTLFLVLEFTLVCGATKTKVRGNVLSSLNAGASETTELTSDGGVLAGNGKGVPSLKTYYNNSGTAVSAKLEGNSGAGFTQNAEEVEGEVTVTALKGNMFVITSR